MLSRLLALVIRGSQSNGQVDGSVASRDSNVTEVYNDYSQQPISHARTSYSDPLPLQNNFNVPRNIPRDTDHYPYESSHSRSISHPSSNSNLLVLPFAQPSEDQLSEPVIHLLSSHSNQQQNLPFPGATGSMHQVSTANPMPHQYHRQLRSQTQWHPTLNQWHGLRNDAFTNRNSQPADINLQPPVYQPADHRSHSSTLTSDPYIRLIQSINESNTKLHSAIIKQQEVLVNQQKFFTEYLITESTLRKEQTNLMQKQLNAILALAPSKERVPPAHFHPPLMVSRLKSQLRNQNNHRYHRNRHHQISRPKLQSRTIRFLHTSIRHHHCNIGSLLASTSMTMSA